MTRIVTILGLMFFAMSCGKLAEPGMAFKTGGSEESSKSFGFADPPTEDCNANNGNGGSPEKEEVSASKCPPPPVLRPCEKEIDKAVDSFYRKYADLLAQQNSDIEDEINRLRKRLKKKGLTKKEIDEEVEKFRKEKEDAFRKFLEMEEEFQKRMDVLRQKCYGDNTDNNYSN